MRKKLQKIAINGPFSGIILTKPIMLCLILAALVMAQSIGVIYTKQNKRLLHAKLQTLYAARDKLHIEWSQLLLEEGTWKADARVERVARNQLGMVMPDKVNVLIP